MPPGVRPIHLRFLQPGEPGAQLGELLVALGVPLLELVNPREHQSFSSIALGELGAQNRRDAIGELVVR
jgi:hypothetical protein